MAARLPAAYWNPHKLPMQQQRADQSEADLGVMRKTRDLKLPPQLRGDPSRWLPPPAQCVGSLQQAFMCSTSAAPRST